jgi:hypothetical protein
VLVQYSPPGSQAFANDHSLIRVPTDQQWVRSETQFQADSNTSILLSLLKTQRQQPGASAMREAESLRARLNRAMRQMVLAQPPLKFLGKYLIVQDHAEGGQAFVQFARGGDGGFFQYAIKCALRSET